MEQEEETEEPSVKWGLFPGSAVCLPWARGAVHRDLGEMDQGITKCLVRRREGTGDHTQEWHGLGK